VPPERVSSRRNGGHRKHENEHKTGIGVVVEVIRDRRPANSHSVAQPGRLEIFPLQAETRFLTSFSGVSGCLPATSNLRSAPN